MGRGGGGPHRGAQKRWPKPTAPCCTGAMRSVAHQTRRPPQRDPVRRLHRPCRPPLRPHRRVRACRQPSAQCTAPSRQRKPTATAGTLVLVPGPSRFADCRSRRCEEQYVTTYHFHSGARAQGRPSRGTAPHKPSACRTWRWDGSRREGILPSLAPSGAPDRAQGRQNAFPQGPPATSPTASYVEPTSKPYCSLRWRASLGCTVATRQPGARADIIVTPMSVRPQGLMREKGSRSMSTLRARP